MPAGPRRTCPNCEAELPRDSLVCVSCGATLRAEGGEATFEEIVWRLEESLARLKSAHRIGVFDALKRHGHVVLPAFLALMIAIGAFSQYDGEINVIVVPILVSALVSAPIHGAFRLALFAWDGILVAAALLYPFLRAPGPALAVVDAQLVTTIGGSLIALGLKLGRVKRREGGGIASSKCGTGWPALTEHSSNGPHLLQENALLLRIIPKIPEV